MSQHFVGDPVEDVEYEEAQGKHGSGYGVDALGPVHEALVKRLPVARHDRGRGRRRGGGGEDAGPLHSGAVLVLQAVTQAVTPEVKAAALPHQVVLLWSQAEGEQVGRSLSTRISFQLLASPLAGWFPNGEKGSRGQQVQDTEQQAWSSIEKKVLNRYDM